MNKLASLGFVIALMLGAAASAAQWTCSGDGCPKSITGPPGPQGPPGPSGGPGGGIMQLLRPTGGDDSDMIQAALNGMHEGVILDGIFRVCKTVVVPRNKGIVGLRTGQYFSGSGSNVWPWPGMASVWCPSNPHFDTSNLNRPQSSFFFVHDNVFFEGFAITGMSWAHDNNVPCINGTNSVGFHATKMVIANCYIGMRFYADHDNPGDQGAVPQVMALIDNTFWWDVVGVETWGAADFRIQNNECASPRWACFQVLSSVLHQIQGNLMEDGNAGIIEGHSTGGVITGNRFNNLSQPIIINSGYGFVVADSLIAATGHEHGAAAQFAAVTLLNALSGTTFSSNQVLYGYAAMYKTEGGGTGNYQALRFDDLGLDSIGGPRVYFDPPSETNLKAWVRH